MHTEDLQTRDRILHVAFTLFLQRGYDHTPIQAIIDAVGIAKGTFYHHFKSKEEMLVTLVEAQSRRVVEALKPVVDDPDLDAVTKILRASQVAVAQKGADLGPETRVLLQQMRSPANRQLAAAIDRIGTLWILPFYARCIRQGVAEGVFHVWDPELAAELFLGSVMALKDRISDLFLAALDGDLAAGDRLVAVYEAIEQALERQLGVAEGTLPIYTSIDIRGLLSRIGETV